MTGDKAAMRSHAQEVMSGLSQSDHQAAAQSLHATLWADHGSLKTCFQTGAVLLGYMPLEDEINPRPAMQTWLDQGGRLATPITNWPQRSMMAAEVDTLESDQFEQCGHGILEPRGQRIIEADDVTAVLVPGRAFDHDGGRLGRGGGFYDRFLATLPANCVTIGVCSQVQLVASVPHDPHDIRVKLVIAV